MFTQQHLQQFNNNNTPFYYYDLDLLRTTINNLTTAYSKYGFIVHYAMKANTNNRLLKAIVESGLGADCVSGNEVKKALEMGFKPSHIVFAGVGKSDHEINIAIQNNIFCFNCESLQELEVINQLAGAQHKIVNVSLRINPNVNAHTHHYITTGLEENKFGINMWQMEEVLQALKGYHHLKLIGLHFHVGSQITDLTVFKNLCTRVNEIQDWLASHHVQVEHINVGGGLGVDYHHPDQHPVPDFEAYFKVFNDFLQLRNGQQVHFELGRAIIAQCGSLISRVLFVKKGVKTNFAILDAGMTELIRPALYQSYHKIENISRSGSTGETLPYDVVGPICESSDCFGKAVELPETKRGDFIAIRTAGAYGEVLASNYNLREKAISVYSATS